MVIFKTYPDYAIATWIQCFKISQLSNSLKVTGHSKKIVAFPPSVQDFCWSIPCTFKRSCYLDLKLINLSLLGRF